MKNLQLYRFGGSLLLKQRYDLYQLCLTRWPHAAQMNVLCGPVKVFIVI